MTQRTPGPWNVCEKWPYQPDGLWLDWERLQNLWIVGVRPGTTVAAVDAGPEGTPEANARLIAAAPELLGACEAAIELLELFPPSEWGYRENQIHDVLRAAIAKARSD